MKRVSTKRARRLAAYARSREEVAERSGGRCEAPPVEGVDCSGRLEHVHHVRLRSQGGTDDPCNLLALCTSHHSWAHAHPAAAHELGLIDFTRAEPRSSAVRFEPVTLPRPYDREKEGSE